MGEGVAAVAAVDAKSALEALDLIDVEYEPLTAYLTPKEALQDTSIPLHMDNEGKPFRFYEAKQHFGDVNQALSRSAFTMERSFSTQNVNHVFLEPHSALAKFDGEGKLTIWSPTQVPHYLHRTLSLVLDMPMQKIRVILPAVGGGFGGKGEVAANELCAALLARKSGRPVKLTLERDEVFFTHKDRHPMHLNVKIGVDEVGMIQAIDFDTLMDAAPIWDGELLSCSIVLP